MADISRWTRDHPSRFWAMHELLESQGVKLVSVDQEYLGSDMPFSATITTAHVEMGHEFLKELRRKTSEGVQRARAAGKQLGRVWGWTFDHDTRQWTIDEPRIRHLYQSVIDQVSYYDISKQIGITRSHIPGYISAHAQKKVVGEEMWLRANDAVSRRYRAPRRGAERSNIYRSLLVCPCGKRMIQATQWGNYRCLQTPRVHKWMSLSARRYVTPAVRALLVDLVMPEDEAEMLRLASEEPPAPLPPDPIAIRAEISKLTLGWAAGRIVDRDYESRVAELEAKLEDPIVIPPRPPEERIAVVRALRPIIALLDEQEPDLGNSVNRLLREALYPIHVSADKTVEVRLREEYQTWIS